MVPHERWKISTRENSYDSRSAGAEDLVLWTHISGDVLLFGQDRIVHRKLGGEIGDMGLEDVLVGWGASFSEQ